MLLTGICYISIYYARTVCGIAGVAVSASVNWVNGNHSCYVTSLSVLTEVKFCTFTDILVHPVTFR